MNNKLLGDWGERQAEAYFRSKSYQIIMKNYRTNFAEIDLIVTDGEYLIFVEVKTRRNQNYGPPESAVNYRKQQKIRQAAKYFLANFAYQRLEPRFDVVSIQIDKNKKELRHIKNAF